MPATTLVQTVGRFETRPRRRSASRRASSWREPPPVTQRELARDRVRRWAARGRRSREHVPGVGLDLEVRRRATSLREARAASRRNACVLRERPERLAEQRARGSGCAIRVAVAAARSTRAPLGQVDVPAQRPRSAVRRPGAGRRPRRRRASASTAVARRRAATCEARRSAGSCAIADPGAPRARRATPRRSSNSTATWQASKQTPRCRRRASLGARAPRPVSAAKRSRRGPREQMRARRSATVSAMVSSMQQRLGLERQRDASCRCARASAIEVRDVRGSRARRSSRRAVAAVARSGLNAPGTVLTLPSRSAAASSAASMLGEPVRSTRAARRRASRAGRRPPSRAGRGTRRRESR